MNYSSTTLDSRLRGYGAFGCKISIRQALHAFTGDTYLKTLSYRRRPVSKFRYIVDTPTNLAPGLRRGDKILRARLFSFTDFYGRHRYGLHHLNSSGAACFYWRHHHKNAVIPAKAGIQVRKPAHSLASGTYQKPCHTGVSRYPSFITSLIRRLTWPPASAGATKF